MKKLTTLAAALALVAGGTLLQAQDQERPQRERQRDGQREGQRGQREGDRGPGSPGGFRNPVMAIFDTDNDGVLSAEEIGKASEVLRALDRNEDGKITADELPRPAFGGPGGPGGPGGGNPGAFLDNLLEEHDKDKDGTLSKEELEGVPERQRAMLLRSDANEDGKIDKAELDQMRERMRSFGGGRRPGGEGGPGGFGRRPGGERGEGGTRPERPRRPE
ncbi:MAG TPA: hypothetical protein VML55_01785 [Planctomycetaceae bacterium]|nr:hypothetical protein [Planctomycetaceae bacterium]